MHAMVSRGSMEYSSITHRPSVKEQEGNGGGVGGEVPHIVDRVDSTVVVHDGDLEVVDRVDVLLPLLPVEAVLPVREGRLHPRMSDAVRGIQ